MEELKRSAPSLNFVLILIQLKCKAYFWDYIQHFIFNSNHPQHVYTVAVFLIFPHTRLIKFATVQNDLQNIWQQQSAN